MSTELFRCCSTCCLNSWKIFPQNDIEIFSILYFFNQQHCTNPEQNIIFYFALAKFWIRHLRTCSNGGENETLTNITLYTDAPVNEFDSSGNPLKGFLVANHIRLEKKEWNWISSNTLFLEKTLTYFRSSF